MNNDHYNWADLPKEILDLIGNRLGTRFHFSRFRAVCTSWRSVIPSSLNNSASSPSLLIDLPPPYTDCTAFLSPVTIFCLENDTRTAACLVKMTQSTSSDKMKIINPLFSHNSIDKIRRQSRRIVKMVNILNLREVVRGYRLKSKMMLPIIDHVSIKKVVLFGESKCGILMIYDVGKLGYFTFKDRKWSALGYKASKYDDIVVYNGQFYVVDSIGTVFWIDAKTMSLVQFSPPLFGPGQVKNLVVSEGELFIVDSYIADEQQMTALDNFERIDMRIYRLDEEWGTWVDVNSLGDRIFVLVKEVCFSVSSKDFPGCDSNCVYFIDSKVEDRRITGDFKRCFSRVFDIEDRRRMKTVDCFPSHLKLFTLP